MNAFDFFEGNLASGRAGINGQLNLMVPGDLITVVLNGMTIEKARAYIFQYQKQNSGTKFKTKVVKETGDLLLGRIG
tara:strand:+ start:369 stop:599 length:231 start_codon:yes stop_codon:yes gene_type:complete